MVLDAARRITEAGTRVYLEVPCLGFCIDMLFVREPGELVAVEFKLADWRRGIRQAWYRRLAADRAFVCLPRPRLSAKFSEALSLTGVGLLRFVPGPGWPLKELVAAPRSTEVWASCRRQAMEWAEEFGLSWLREATPSAEVIP